MKDTVELKPPRTLTRRPDRSTRSRLPTSSRVWNAAENDRQLVHALHCFFRIHDETDSLPIAFKSLRVPYRAAQMQSAPCALTHPTLADMTASRAVIAKYPQVDPQTHVPADSRRRATIRLRPTCCADPGSARAECSSAVACCHRDNDVRIVSVHVRFLAVVRRCGAAC